MLINVKKSNYYQGFDKSCKKALHTSFVQFEFIFKSII